jgi:hypothetical protein
MKGMTEIRVQQNVLDGGHMMVMTETPEKPKWFRFVNVDKKAVKKWDELTPRQKQRASLKMPRKISSGKKKKEMFIAIPVKPNDD